MKERKIAMNTNKTCKRVKPVVLAFVFAIGLSSSLVYGYWVDRIQADWDIPLSRHIAIQITGLVPPEATDAPLQEPDFKPEAESGSSAETAGLEGEQNLRETERSQEGQTPLEAEGIDGEQAPEQFQAEGYGSANGSEAISDSDENADAGDADGKNK